MNKDKKRFFFAKNQGWAALQCQAGRMLDAPGVRDGSGYGHVTCITSYLVLVIVSEEERVGLIHLMFSLFCCRAGEAGGIWKCCVEQR